jgi:hypothetical protein
MCNNWKCETVIVVLKAVAVGGLVESRVILVRVQWWSVIDVNER